MWVIDSECSQFICNDLSQLKDVIDVNVLVRLGDITTVFIEKAGSVILFGHAFYCLYAPSFRVSLISVPILDECGFTCVFEDNRVVVEHKTRKLGCARLNSSCDLYLFDPADPMALRALSKEEIFPTGPSGEQALVTTCSQTTLKAKWKKDSLVSAVFWIRNRKSRIGGAAEEQDSDSEDCGPTPTSKLTPFQEALLTDLQTSESLSRPMGAPARHSIADINKWHARLAHVNMIAVNELLKKMPGIPILPTPRAAVCDACV